MKQSERNCNERWAHGPERIISGIYGGNGVSGYPVMISYSRRQADHCLAAFPECHGVFRSVE